ncbi:MAG: pyridoxal-phosphate dependent enzyme [Thermococcus sp.]|uniref:pyridoxal-phosphate dependent enzyme n=1 Tax=Thermococcus sp. TaxID=35749 RepID=UPI002633E656|nr:pyridoxal-phosphate dependent enzyme [Thermococcus sp.]MCD6139792.1 pyridoxal-phosphate dependent enzyme [Thermococcus sp.]MCD6144581.1 pyridoxal-phosphate dependent enzyme [Thermococcus sp.]
MYFAKLEFFNPFSRSIKDRAVFNMLMKAIEREDIDGVRRIFEATSGNVGISLASLSNVLGIGFRAYLPKPTPMATQILLKVLGVEVVMTDFETIDPNMVEYVVKEARKARAANLNQFENEDNFEAHYRFTAREIDEQLKSIGKRPDIIIAGIGTSGHIGGIAKYFKKRYTTKVIGVVPAKGEKIPGIKRLETKPKWFFKVEIDEVIEIIQREAIEGSIQIAREDGLLIGLSSGAVVKAFEKIHDKYLGTTVLIFPDDGFKYVEVFEKYLSEVR